MLQTIGDEFLYCNDTLIHFEAPKLEAVGKEFLSWNEILTHFNAPMVKKIGDGFLWHNKTLSHFDAPNLQTIGGGFLIGHPQRKKFLPVTKKGLSGVLTDLTQEKPQSIVDRIGTFKSR